MDLQTKCVIAGGGPAGMMAAYLLARAGVDVIVLEKHADFLRDFRGDTIHPSTLTVMHESLHVIGRQSGVSDLLGSFVDEGLTELLATRAFGPEAARNIYTPNLAFVSLLAGAGVSVYFALEARERAGVAEGATQAYRIALRRPECFAGVIALTTALVSLYRPAEKWLGDCEQSLEAFAARVYAEEAESR